MEAVFCTSGSEIAPPVGTPIASSLRLRTGEQWAIGQTPQSPDTLSLPVTSKVSPSHQPMGNLGLAITWTFVFSLLCVCECFACCVSEHSVYSALRSQQRDWIPLDWSCR